MLDWLAAPFGTQEDLLLSYGVSGTDYNLDANNQPRPTTAGTSNAGYVPAAISVAAPLRAVPGGFAGVHQSVLACWIQPRPSTRRRDTRRARWRR